MINFSFFLLAVFGFLDLGLDPDSVTQRNLDPIRIRNIAKSMRLSLWGFPMLGWSNSDRRVASLSKSASISSVASSWTEKNSKVKNEKINTWCDYLERKSRLTNSANSIHIIQPTPIFHHFCLLLTNKIIGRNSSCKGPTFWIVFIIALRMLCGIHVPI